MSATWQAIALLVLVTAGIGQDQAEQQRITELIQQLENDQTRDSAVEQLVAIGEPAFPYLIDRLILLHESDIDAADGRSDPSVVMPFLRVIGRVRPKIDSVAESLVLRCRGEPKRARYVIQAVGDIVPYCRAGDELDNKPEYVLAPMFAVVLEQHLAAQHDLAQVTEDLAQVAERAGQRGSLRADAKVEDLIKALTDESAYVRRAAAELLAYRKDEAVGALKALRKALLSSHQESWISFSEKLPYPSEVHDTIAWAMVTIDPVDPATSVAHAYRLQHRDPAVRLAAVQALQRMRDPATVPGLIAALESDRPDPVILREAITALGMIGPTAKDAIPTLEKLAEHEDKQIAERAKAALRQIRRN